MITIASRGASPFGATEAFILPEVADHLAAGWDVWLVPLARGAMVHDEGLLARTIDAPLVSPAILAGAAAEAIAHPWRTGRLLTRMLRAPGAGLALRNLAVFPKGLWLGRRLRRERFDHVHIHWIAAPATMGVVAAMVAGIPCSITAHRYDIAQNNLLAWKAGRAHFVRAIDAPGAAEIAEKLAPSARAPEILHMGVAVAPAPAPRREGVLAPLRLAVAARLVAKKGHAYLLDAIRHAIDRGAAVSLDIFGDGPLKAELVAQAERLEIAAAIRWRGTASHDALLEALLSGAFDASVLPSVTAEDGDKEGIPVFLIESMGAGLPVITTPNGGILELAGEGRGIVVPERDVDALGEAIVRLATDGAERARLSAAGRAHVLRDFEIGACMAQLRGLIAGG